MLILGYMLTILNINSHPEKKEQSSKSHEQRGHGRNDQLLHDFTGKLGRGHLQISFIKIDNLISQPTS